MDELREKLAAQEHERWSRWMRYLFEQGVIEVDGTWTMPAWAVVRWDGQMTTPYSELSEKEKDSDRKEADQTLVLIREHILASVEPVPDKDVNPP